MRHSEGRWTEGGGRRADGGAAAAAAMSGEEDYSGGDALLPPPTAVGLLGGFGGVHRHPQHQERSQALSLCRCKSTLNGPAKVMMN